jgi:hypothetical protein
VNQQFESVYQAYSRECARQIELALVTRIEEIEGRVPSNEEIAKYGIKQYETRSGKVEYHWKGIPIVRAEGFPMKITKLY